MLEPKCHIDDICGIHVCDMITVAVCVHVCDMITVTACVSDLLLDELFLPRANDESTPRACLTIMDLYIGPMGDPVSSCTPFLFCTACIGQV